MKSNLNEIAKLAGVSAATVSRVLNGQRNVAAATRERVIDAARKCHYAASWHVSTRPTVALIVNNLHFFGYFAEILPYLEEELSLHNYQFEIIPIKNVELLQSQPICGAISLLAKDRLQHEWETIQTVPLVCINTSAQRLDNIYSVSSNLNQCIRLAVEHLHRLGHRKINMVLDSSPPGISWSDQERVNGFRDSMREFGLDINGLVHFSGGVANIVKPIAIALDQGATAFIASAYGQALPTFQALQLLGCRIPDDISLVVREERDITPYLLPKPTLLRLDLRMLAVKAVDMLEELIGGRSMTENITIGYHLQEGTTTAPAPETDFITRRRQLLGTQKFI